MRAKLILNPVAGNDTAHDDLPLINARLRARIGSLDIVLTTGPGDAEALARQAAADGYDHLFIAGGDGTVNEALNGVASVRQGLSQVTFGILPRGTGNDFASAIGIPAAAEDAIEALLRAPAVPIDVGRMNERYFVNVSSGGFLAAASVATSERLKTLTGRLAYLIGGAQVLLDYEPVGTRLVLDDDAFDASLYAFAVCNAPLVGGGRMIAPEAVMDDGLFDVCLIHAMPTVDFIGLLASVSAGEHVHDDRVDYIRTRHLTLEFNRAIPLNTDGQVFEGTHCEYQLLPRAARFLVPSAG
jgi:diacylglycerol kinase (ATP)